jgi:PAS domain S-box-containing protein
MWSRFRTARLRIEELGLHFARGIQPESSFDTGVSDRTLLLRFTVAVLLALLAPATFALVYLNLAHLPAAEQNFAYVPWWSIGYFVVAASLIAALLRSRLKRQIRALGEGRPTNFAWLERLTIEGVIGVVVYVCAGLLMIGWEAAPTEASRAPSTLVVLGIALTNIVNILIPAFLYVQDLLGRYFGRFADGRTLVPVRMRILAVGVGNTFVACSSFLIYQATVETTSISDAWLIWALVLVYAGTVSYIAYAGFAVSIEPLADVLANRSSDVRLLEPRSVDEVGALMHRLKELLDNRASAQRDLRASEARTRMFAEAASDLFFEMDADLKFSFLSDRFRSMTGIDPALVIGQSALDMRQQFEPEEPDANEDLRAHRPYRNYRFSVRAADGNLLHLQTSAVPYFDESGRFCGYRGAGTNVTEIVEAQKALRVNQAELAQAQKMEAVGQLTGGVAHDFNNLLTVILGNLELLIIHASDQPKLLRHIEAAMSAAARGGALTQRLLAFSRRQSLRPVAIDVARLLRGMEELLRRTLGENIRIEVAAERGLWACMVDPHQLESAILNLALNARDAMPHGGRLSMDLANCGGVSGVKSAGDGANDYVRLRVADTGTGIAPDVLPHVFEPFFTTKGPGEGSGLGLSMVYGFINQSGGRVVLTSALGAGTTAEILLPRAAEGVLPLEAPAGRATVAGDGQTILVVEDDPGVSAVITEGLSQLGYRVISVATGEEALAGFGESGRVDLILSDIVLPGGLSGLDVEEAIRKQHPDVRFVFMSGYAQDEIARKGPRQGRGLSDLDILRKPFQLTDLADRVIEALAAEA